MDFKFYFSLFLRRLHWFMLFLVIGSAIGLTLAKVLPPVYRAEAKLLVESEQIPGDLAISTFRTEATEQLQIIRQRILTRDTLVDMANRLDIYEGRTGRQRPDTDTLVEDLRTRIGIITTGGSQRRGQTSATLVSVRFEAETSRMAATVANELVTLIQREDVEMRTRVAGQTLDFFEQEVERLDTVLVSQEGEILKFKEANQDSLPDSLEFRRSQQAAAQERLLQMERQEAALKDRRTRLVALAESGQTESGPPRTAEEKQLQNMQDELEALLTVLSPTNPKVKLLEARVETLRVRVQVQRAQASDLPSENGQMSSTEIQIAELDGQIDYILQQRAQIKKNLERLAVSIEATPSNAITLGTLERDYANTRRQYDQAVAKRAQAQTGDIIEGLRRGQRITVVEQAVTPSEPEKPNRKLIAAGGVGGGMIIGLAVVMLMELLKKGIRRPVDLTSRLGITPFATLPYYRTRAEMIRRRTIILSVLGFFLIAIPAGLWAIDTYVIQLDRVLDIITGQLGLADASQGAAPRLV